MRAALAASAASLRSGAAGVEPAVRLAHHRVHQPHVLDPQRLGRAEDRRVVVLIRASLDHAEDARGPAEHRGLGFAQKPVGQAGGIQVVLVGRGRRGRVHVAARVVMT